MREMTTTKLSPTIFREYDIRGLVDQDLTEEAVFLVGKALGTRIREAGGSKAAVGRDARLSGPRFGKAMFSALTSTGVDVLDLGVVPTPLTYFAAHTAGVVALLLELAPSASPEQIRAALVEDARPLGEGRRFGAGALDACAAAERCPAPWAATC